MVTFFFPFIFLASLLLSSPPAEAACSDITGNWYDSHSIPTAQLIFRIEKHNGAYSSFAVTYNPNWGTGSVSYDSSSSIINMLLDDGENITGSVASDCSNITWSTVPAAWIKVPKVHQVHVVFMNHLDVGYAGFAAVIINKYFQSYFPRAIRLAEEMELYRPDESFIYTTQPWLVDLYLDCPPNMTLNGIQVKCPSPSEIESFDAAIRKGYIAWHAGPMNMQIEFMNEAVLEAGLSIAQRLNKKYLKSTTVLSQRDVPGLTMCSLKTLNKYGVKAVSVGVNSGSAPPAVPKIFLWKVDGENEEDGGDGMVIALWHAGGYPNNPGRDLEGARGISYRDCTLAPGTAHILCFAFRTDNTGPPNSLDEIDRYYMILREEYPGAAVFASTFDNFTNSVSIDHLPVLTNKEIGDTWIQGIASDPLKSSMYRSMALSLDQCLKDGACDLSDPVVSNATRFLIKLPEHTWGLPGVENTEDWANSDFEKARTTAEFIANRESWFEQRTFINLTLEASEGHKLNEYLTSGLSELKLTDPPNLSDYNEIDASKVFTLFNGKVEIGFDNSTGPITHLIYSTSSNKQLVFAGTNQSLGQFTYITYNESDFFFMQSRYDYAFNAGYDKPGSDVADPLSQTWSTKLIGLYQCKDNENYFLTHLTMLDSKAHDYYGAPADVWIKVNLSTSDSSLLRIDFDLVLVNKTSTRLPESTMFSFYPSPPATGAAATRWKARVFKVDDKSSFTVGSVVNNGSQFQHAAQSVLLTSSSSMGSSSGPTIAFNSTDVPIVCPIIDDGHSPTSFPVPLDSLVDDSVIGIAFNIHNNIWNTNYPLYYPFVSGDENFRARFTVTFQ
ncbi:PREDICTED: uncharacterized protein LOC105316568 [Amphimedon queenslandica]|nr:PREDICTED: uncharacterized protein LOC105316568 [Amphimedon queenslandica]|eukprot:XP_011409863.1 PREDICTED: uncharacterized protein LOC105316568 [Amphimedon queenslandica]